MQLTADFFQQTAKVFTVSELTRNIRGTLETKFGAVWVQGEISNYKLHPSGHQYFTLKDQRAQISCVIWRDTMLPLRQPLADGAQVQVFGTVTVFEGRGQYQLNVQIIQPRGVGVLQAKFEALKRKLEAEGLFAAERKRSLPRFPRRIGIVTSPSGAAIRDILNVLNRRAPWLQILINPVRVQGTGAAQEIAFAIRELATPNENWKPLDLIVIARGGGSMEDLWEFNEEIIARALQSRSPERELVMRRNRFIDLHRRFVVSPPRVVENAKQRFARIEGILRVLGPDATLRRGYSITTNEGGKIIRTVATIRPRMKIRTRVSDGEFGSEVL